jgi:hypothetical protein
MVEVKVGIERVKLIRGVIVFVILAVGVKKDREASMRVRKHL